MALTPETGAGVAGADSYATLAQVLAYWQARTHDPLSAAWTGAATDALREGAIREATGYLDAHYGQRYRGIRRGYVQGREWPRSEACDDAGYPLPDLPPQLVDAVCELAARALSARLKADLDRGGRIASEAVSGAVSVSYFADAPGDTTWGFVDGLLAPILATKAAWGFR